MPDLISSAPAPGGEFLFYQTEDGRTRLQVRVQDETVWLSQKLLSELFQVLPDRDYWATVIQAITL